ncbi:MAG: GNAT family N-acetyltransferase [Acidimicrobiales bacterium]
MVTDWFAALHDEATPHQPGDDLAVLAQRHLLAGQLWLWIDNGQPVSLAAINGGAGHGVLYTDLANPTSNAIYQAIGHVADHDAEDRRFDEPGTAARSQRR